MRILFIFSLVVLMMLVPQDIFGVDSPIIGLDCPQTHRYDVQTKNCEIWWASALVAYPIIFAVITCIAILVLVIGKKFPTYKKNMYLIISIVLLFLGFKSVFFELYNIFTVNHPNIQLELIIGATITSLWSIPFFVVGLIFLRKYRNLRK